MRLNEQDYHDFKLRIPFLAKTQRNDEYIAADLNYTLEEFQEILKEYSEFKRLIQLGRANGKGQIVETLYNKAVVDKNLDALKFMAQEFMGLGEKARAMNAVRQSASLNIPLSQMTTPQLVALLEEEMSGNEND